MAIKAQPIKVKTAALLAQVMKAQAIAQEGLAGKLEKVRQIQYQKVDELRKKADEIEAQTVEEFAADDYSHRHLINGDGFAKIITMLELAADDYMTISQDSDLAKYI